MPALVHAKELKVAAEVENIELVLILTIQQPRTQTGAASNHLPELRFAHDLFKEHQIQHLRHVNAGVQHIHGNSDLRHFFRVGKLVNGTLRIGHVIVDDLGKARKMWVFLIENPEDFLCMGVIFRKNDGLAQLAAVVDGQAVGHQRVQYLSDGVFIENPFVQRRGRNALR